MSDELATEVRQAAEAAVAALADGAGGALDYSRQSLVVLDAVLDNCAEATAQVPEPALHNLIQRAGCYVLEVGRREFGGRYRWWEKRSAPVLVVGEPEFSIALHTWDKVAGRLGGDSSDSVAFLYEGFAQRVRTATPGTSALYV